MRIEALDVSKGRGGLALPRTSLEYATGLARLAVVETEQRPTVLGLIVSGRMRSDTGLLLVDGAADDSGLVRRRIALVDAPDVSDPAPNVTVFTVAAEELMFAGRPANPVATRQWLSDAGFLSVARVPIADIPPSDRIRLLLELTVLRPGVEGIVLVSPDRHGGDPFAWWELAESYAADGYAILVIAGATAGTVLRDVATRSDASDSTTEVGR